MGEESGHKNPPTLADRSAAEEAGLRRLMRRARAGDGPAYLAVARRYEARLFNAAARIVGDRAEAAELTRRALLDGHDHVGTYRGGDAYAWLFSRLLPLAVAHVRRDARTRPFAAAGGAERDALLLAALGRLDVEGRALIVMRDVEGFDHQRIAALIGKPEPAALAALLRARQALRRDLAPLLSADARPADARPAAVA